MQNGIVVDNRWTEGLSNEAQTETASSPSTSSSSGKLKIDQYALYDLICRGNDEILNLWHNALNKCVAVHFFLVK